MSCFDQDAHTKGTLLFKAFVCLCMCVRVCVCVLHRHVQSVQCTHTHTYMVFMCRYTHTHTHIHTYKHPHAYVVCMCRQTHHLCAKPGIEVRCLCQLHSRSRCKANGRLFMSSCSCLNTCQPTAPAAIPVTSSELTSVCANFHMTDFVQASAATAMASPYVGGHNRVSI